MARIDWAFLCDLAFYDRQDRLCIVGVLRELTTPALPLTVGQLMLVAHMVDLRQVEEFDVSVAMVTPSGIVSTPRAPGCATVEVAYDYVLVTLRDVPIKEEGVYRFQLAFDGHPVASVEIPVLALGVPAAAGMH